MNRAPDRTLAALALVLVGGCAGSHLQDRPLVRDCETALDSGQHGDPCEFIGECGRGDRARHGAVCDNGVMLRVSIDETITTGPLPCAGALSTEVGAWLVFEPVGACLDVTMCTDEGATAGIRTARMCQVGAAAISPTGTPATDCVAAVIGGDDGDACSGSFACVADRIIRTDATSSDQLPVIGWCDAGILRLAPSQTLFRGSM